MLKKYTLIIISAVLMGSMPLYAYRDYVAEATYNIAMREAYEREARVAAEIAHLERLDREKKEKEYQTKIKIIITLLTAAGYIIYGAAWLTYQAIRIPIVLAIKLWQCLTGTTNKKSKFAYNA